MPAYQLASRTSTDAVWDEDYMTIDADNIHDLVHQLIDLWEDGEIDLIGIMRFLHDNYVLTAGKTDSDIIEGTDVSTFAASARAVLEDNDTAYEQLLTYLSPLLRVSV